MTNNTFKSEIIDLKIVNKEDKIKVVYKDNIVFGFIGEIFGLEDNIREIDYIFDIYMNGGIEEIREIEGFFSIIVFDEKKSEMKIFQDKNTSLEHIYYCENKDSIFVSNKLDRLTQISGIEKEVNIEALPTYLHYSFVPGKNTLMKSVYKIPSNHVLVKNKEDNLYFEKLNEVFEEMKNEKCLLDKIENSIEKRIDLDKKIGFSLSGGFDSNLLFWLASKRVKDREIDVFSYGSKSDTSEIHGSLSSPLLLFQQAW